MLGKVGNRPESRKDDRGFSRMLMPTHAAANRAALSALASNL